MNSFNPYSNGSRFLIYDKRETGTALYPVSILILMEVAF